MWQMVVARRPMLPPKLSCQRKRLLRAAPTLWSPEGHGTCDHCETCHRCETCHHCKTCHHCETCRRCPHCTGLVGQSHALWAELRAWEVLQLQPSGMVMWPWPGFAPFSSFSIFWPF